MFELKTRVLVVDDFATMRKVARKMLHDLGFTDVEEAIDGREALVTLRHAASINLPFQILISDWRMPHLNGVDLFKSVISIPELQKINFLMITSESDPKEIASLKNFGITDHLIKPFTEQNLKNKLLSMHKKSLANAA